MPSGESVGSLGASSFAGSVVGTSATASGCLTSPTSTSDVATGRFCGFQPAAFAFAATCMRASSGEVFEPT
jgi:hypothetical protein